jgi:hypothetical protein
MDFINICTNQPEKTETPPDRSDASIQEASPVDAMANSP